MPPETVELKSYVAVESPIDTAVGVKSTVKSVCSLLEKDTKEPDDVSEKNHNNDSGDDGYNGALHVITLRHQQYLNLRYFRYRGLLTSHFALRAEFDFLSSCHEFLCDKSVPAAIRAIVFNHFRSSFR